jgi:uncharacterized protein involved in tellurium resistance
MNNEKNGSKGIIKAIYNTFGTKKNEEKMSEK